MLYIGFLACLYRPVRKRKKNHEFQRPVPSSRKFNFTECPSRGKNEYTNTNLSDLLLKCFKFNLACKLKAQLKKLEICKSNFLNKPKFKERIKE